MNRELPPTSDPLLRLLDEWQPRPVPSPGFEQELARRIQERAAARGWRRWLAAAPPQLRWSTALATMALLLIVGVFVYQGGNGAGNSAPAYQTAQADAMVRDLQTLANDGDLLEHLDFLSTPMNAAPQLQDRD